MARMVLSKLGINSNNDKILASLSFVLFMPLLFDFIAGSTKGSTSIITMVVYGISFIVIIVIGRQNISFGNILTVLCFYFICLLNISLFPDSKQYFQTGQYLILFFYLPLGFIVFRSISSWDNFIPILFIFTPFAILMGGYILLFTNITAMDSITYMEFSYALLPFVCASYALYITKKRIVGLLLFLIGLIEMLSFGCRGAVLSSFILVLFLTIINSKRNKWGIFVLSIVVLVLALNFNTIVYYLSQMSLFEDSYIIKRILYNRLFEDDTREIILMNCERRLATMGTNISGLFGDRIYCGSVYPHNIVYEVLMQWGWVLGSLLLLYFAFLFIRGFVQNKTSRLITVYFFCAVLLRFFVSGSYLNSGLFWLMIASLQSVKNTKKPAILPKNV